MDIWRSLTGMVTAQVTSAEPTGVLAEIHRSGIELEQVRFIDELTVQFSFHRADLNRIQKITDKRGEDFSIRNRWGIYWRIRSVLKRKMLLAGIMFFILLTVFLPTRIFFFRVEGNQNVPTNQILELAVQCGIRFGSSRRDVRSEKVKNALLSAAPQLEWAGINTSGCVATISVRERQSTQQIPSAQGISSIVALRDGVIRDITVTNGSAACKVGQAVKAGQVLISGYTDCGLTIRAGRAKGEVYADTSRTLSFVLPENSAYRGQVTEEIKKYRLLFGKNQINFCQDSGILDDSCVKMYEEKYVTLPGGFVLPIAIITETWVYYQEMSSTASDDSQSALSAFAQQYLQSQMVAGTVLTRQEDFSSDGDVARLEGVYACFEMIGRERNEEIIKP